MSAVLNMLSFRKMLSPYLLQVLSRTGIGGVCYGTRVLLQRDHRASWVALLFGTLVARVLFEKMLLSFQAYDRLNEIGDALKNR